jgi:hypothetical protein
METIENKFLSNPSQVLFVLPTMHCFLIPNLTFNIIHAAIQGMKYTVTIQKPNLVRYSNGLFVSLSEMVQFSNGLFIFMTLHIRRSRVIMTNSLTNFSAASLI